ncbi:Chloride channel protein CLC-c [Dissostichus eleginoides]|uniref:Chloride channel protein CLC-c n=1 Tax=Dissostichus eleginoides TaxID=100907 RepID=A0AAD9EZQ1_DISEL|nr:Chloride channel protein CLC-c [Dissostichus eleginoides]
MAAKQDEEQLEDAIFLADLLSKEQKKMRFSNCSSFWLINHQPCPIGVAKGKVPSLGQLAVFNYGTRKEMLTLLRSCGPSLQRMHAP